MSRYDMRILSLFSLCMAQQIQKHICCASHCRNTAAISAHDVEQNPQNMLNELADSERYWTNEPFHTFPILTLLKYHSVSSRKMWFCTAYLDDLRCRISTVQVSL